MKQIHLVFSILLAAFFTSCNNGGDLRSGAESLVVEVRIFEKSHGKLPESLTEMGKIEEEGIGPFYEKRGAEFVVWYGMDLGGSMLYDSKTNTWEER